MENLLLEGLLFLCWPTLLFQLHSMKLRRQVMQSTTETEERSELLWAMRWDRISFFKKCWILVSEALFCPIYKATMIHTYGRETYKLIIWGSLCHWNWLQALQGVFVITSKHSLKTQQRLCVSSNAPWYHLLVCFSKQQWQFERV